MMASPAVSAPLATAPRVAARWTRCSSSSAFAHSSNFCERFVDRRRGCQRLAAVRQARRLTSRDRACVVGGGWRDRNLTGGPSCISHGVGAKPHGARVLRPLADSFDFGSLTGYFGQPGSVVERVQRARESSPLVVRLGWTVHTRYEFLCLAQRVGNLWHRRGGFLRCRYGVGARDRQRHVDRSAQGDERACDGPPYCLLCRDRSGERRRRPRTHRTAASPPSCSRPRVAPNPRMP
jgi:hypothetical protein